MRPGTTGKKTEGKKSSKKKTKKEIDRGELPRGIPLVKKKNNSNLLIDNGTWGKKKRKTD